MAPPSRTYQAWNVYNVLLLLCASHSGSLCSQADKGRLFSCCSLTWHQPSVNRCHMCAAFVKKFGDSTLSPLSEEHSWIFLMTCFHKCLCAKTKRRHPSCILWRYCFFPYCFSPTCKTSFLHHSITIPKRKIWLVVALPAFLLTASSMSCKATTVLIVCRRSQALKQKLLCEHKEAM